MELEDLPFSFHLPDADLAGELGGGLAVPLQREGAVQRSLAAAPDVVEGDFLWATKTGAQRRLPAAPVEILPPPATPSGMRWDSSTSQRASHQGDQKASLLPPLSLWETTQDTQSPAVAGWGWCSWSGSPAAPIPAPHLVLGQQFAPPQCMGDVMDGEAQVVVAVLEGQGLGLLQQVPSQCPLQLQHLLWAAGQVG